MGFRLLALFAPPTPTRPRPHKEGWCWVPSLDTSSSLPSMTLKRKQVARLLAALFRAGVTLGELPNCSVSVSASLRVVAGTTSEGRADLTLLTLRVLRCKPAQRAWARPLLFRTL